MSLSQTGNGRSLGQNIKVESFNVSQQQWSFWANSLLFKWSWDNRPHPTEYPSCFNTGPKYFAACISWQQHKKIYFLCFVWLCFASFFYLFSTEVEQVTSKQNCLLKLVYKLTLSCIITPCGKKCILWKWLYWKWTLRLVFIVSSTRCNTTNGHWAFFFVFILDILCVCVPHTQRIRIIIVIYYCCTTTTTTIALLLAQGLPLYII